MESMNWNASTPVEISRLHWPVTTLGYGRRIGIWLQGCSIRCPGCCSRDTWQTDPRSRTTVGQVVAWIEAHTIKGADGITISGGEPFDQPEALSALLTALRTLRSRSGSSWDILVYSGYRWAKLRRVHARILECADVVISEPFVDALPVVKLRGSSNQQVHLLTRLGHQRYVNIDKGEDSPGMQLHFDGSALWMSGIPQRNELQLIAERLSRHGISMSSESWNASQLRPPSSNSES
jgi:anaerobic ribonucleoside-triphosphate reductase activating protein